MSLISEATSLIWRERCKWKIQNEGDPVRAPSNAEIENQWIATINRMILFDVAASGYEPRKVTKANIPPKNLVIDTWWDVVKSNSDLEWEVLTRRKRKGTRVLVGIERNTRAPH
jgi:hypothetical protein